MMRALVWAECIKLIHQRWLLFFGFIFVPLFMMLASLLVGAAITPRSAHNVVPLVHGVARAFATVGNPLAQLFYALGAAAIFTVDYRYQGWRHIVPRRDRAVLLIAKWLAFMLCALISVLMLGIGHAVIRLASSASWGGGAPITDASGLSLLWPVTALAISMLELAALGSTAAAIAVITRAMMPTVLIPFLLSFGSVIALAYYGSDVQNWPLPSYAADGLREALSQHATPATWALKAGELILWCVAGYGIALGWFRRQDLATE